MTDHRKCCPDMFPPDDWQDTHPGETWLAWYRRTRGGPWWGLVSLCCGWPMAEYECINPQHLD